MVAGNDLTDQAARRDFAERNGSPALGPVVVVIPAYREAATIAQVVEEIPAEACGLAVSVLVVVDGDDDGTSALAAAAGARVCVAPVNRGQGAAYRIGYALAVECGAELLVTMDADGQNVAGEIPVVLGPVASGEADLVTGSRRLGRSVDPEPVRRAGVVVFAALVSLLCRQRITDPANGLRAMRASVPGSLTLVEDQYQAAELLIGAIRHGFRVVERPVTMRPRASGSTRKGATAHYARNFARVVLSTWLRER